MPYLFRLLAFRPSRVTLDLRTDAETRLARASRFERKHKTVGKLSRY